MSRLTLFAHPEVIQMDRRMFRTTFLALQQESEEVEQPLHPEVAGLTNSWVVQPEAGLTLHLAMCLEVTPVELELVLAVKIVRDFESDLVARQDAAPVEVEASDVDLETDSAAKQAAAR
jgi:hypothetical protein